MVGRVATPLPSQDEKRYATPRKEWRTCGIAPVIATGGSLGADYPRGTSPMQAVSRQASEWVWNHSPFRGRTLLVHLAIARVVGAEGVYAEPESVLAADARCARNAVVTALGDLRRGGYLELIEAGGGRGRSSRYRLLTAETARPPRGLVVQDRAVSTEKPSPDRAVSVENRAVSSRARAIRSPSLITRQQQDNVASLPLSDRDAVTEVFDAWRDATGHTKAKLDDARRRVIVKALKLHPLPDVVDAVRGWRHSPHHRGENAQGTVYDGLKLLLRDAEQIEKFRDLERSAGSRSEPKIGWMGTP